MCACWIFGVERAFIDGVRFGKSPVTSPVSASIFYENVVFDILDAGFSTNAGVQDSRTGKHSLLGVEHGGKHLVVNFHQPAALFRRGFGLGNDGGDPLADEARDIVEHVGVVGIDVEVVVRPS